MVRAKNAMYTNGKQLHIEPNKCCRFYPMTPLLKDEVYTCCLYKIQDIQDFYLEKQYDDADMRKELMKFDRILFKTQIKQFDGV